MPAIPGAAAVRSSWQLAWLISVKTVEEGVLAPAGLGLVVTSCSPLGSLRPIAKQRSALVRKLWPCSLCRPELGLLRSPGRSSWSTQRFPMNPGPAMPKSVQQACLDSSGTKARVVKVAT